MKRLNQLLSIHAPSGNEEGLAAFIKMEIADHVDEISVDALGNLIAIKRAKSNDNHNKIMLTTNMDESGLMATVIEEDGFVRFAVIGNLQASGLLHKKVRFQNGAIGIIGSEKEEGFAVKDMYIDPIGAEIRVGDVAVLENSATISDKYISAKALGSRIGCYILIELIHLIKECNHDIYFVFTVQETLGHRGAKTAAFAIEPDYAIHVGVTSASSRTGDDKSNIKLGKGPAVKIKDTSILAHPMIKKLLVSTAEMQKIAFQLEVSSKGSSDAGIIQLSKGGVPSGAISVPIRYLYSPNEVCSVNDVKAVMEILKEAILNGGYNES